MLNHPLNFQATLPHQQRYSEVDVRVIKQGKMPKYNIRKSANLFGLALLMVGLGSGIVLVTQSQNFNKHAQTLSYNCRVSKSYYTCNQKNNIISLVTKYSGVGCQNSVSYKLIRICLPNELCHTNMVYNNIITPENTRIYNPGGVGCLSLDLHY